MDVYALTRIMLFDRPFFILRIPKLQEELGIKLNKELGIPILSIVVEQVMKISHNHRTDYQECLDHIYHVLSHDVSFYACY